VYFYKIITLDNLNSLIYNIIVKNIFTTTKNLLMNYIKTTLTQLGLTDGEINVYLAGLSLGPSLASTLAKKTNLGRTLVYHQLELLEKKGLINKVGEPSGLTYSMEPPIKLKALIELQQAVLAKTQKKLEQAIPALEALTSEELRQAKVKFYEGTEGMKTAVIKTLQVKNKEVLSFMPGLHIIEKTFGKEFLKTYIKKRDNNAIKGKNIWTDAPHSLNPLSKKVAKKIRIAQDLNFESTIVVHDDKVTVLSSEKYMSAFEIESLEFADTMKSFFNKIWKHSKEPTS